MKPFRWDFSRAEQLGRLSEGPLPEAYPDFLEDVKAAAARILAFSEDGYIVFIGRSPESIYDYLSGAFSKSPKVEDFVLLNVSNRYEIIQKSGRHRAEAYAAAKVHFSGCAVAPQQILARSKPTILVDLVAHGSTFKNLTKLLLTWADEEGIPQNQLLQKLAYRGLTSKTHTSPNTYRWHQHAEWIESLHIRNIKNISIPYRLWDYLGNFQPKTMPTNPPASWNSEQLLEPPRQEGNILALRQAYHLYQTGAAEGRVFAGLLAKEEAMAESWFRSLTLQLKS